MCEIHTFSLSAAFLCFWGRKHLLKLIIFICFMISYKICNFYKLKHTNRPTFFLFPIFLAVRFFCRKHKQNSNTFAYVRKRESDCLVVRLCFNDKFPWLRACSYILKADFIRWFYSKFSQEKHIFILVKHTIINIRIDPLNLNNVQSYILCLQSCTYAPHIQFVPFRIKSF